MGARTRPLLDGPLFEKNRLLYKKYTDTPGGRLLDGWGRKIGFRKSNLGKGCQNSPIFQLY